MRKSAVSIAVSLLVAATVALAGPLASPTAGVTGLLGSGTSTTTAYVDPLLTAALSAASPTTTVEAAAVLPGVATATELATIKALGLSVGAFERLPVVAVKGVPSALTALSTLPFVRSVWFNAPVDESLDQSTAQIQARDAWSEPRAAGEPTGYTGRGVTVATIDSGIDGLHPGVSYPDITVQNVKPVGFKDLVWGTAVEGIADTDLTSGHGSHVAGIIAGRGTADGHYKGVAPGAHLIGLGATDGLEMLTILQSYDWIIKNKDAYGIRVINNSWAHSDPQVPYVTGNPLDIASKAAVDAGIVVVFAAGNAGQASGDVYNHYARNDWVISVGGVNKNGSLAVFSSRGNDTWHANVMAPGNFIASVRATLGPISQANATPFDLSDPAAPRVVPVDQWPYYTVKSGTSMATPHVSGVVALMLEANPQLTPAQVRQILIATATAVPGCSVIDCGAGTVNALASVRAAKGMAANSAPTASLTATPTSGEAPLLVTLDASGSVDPDGTIASYRWDWNGDGEIDDTTTAAAVTHTFASGVHRPRVTAVDDRGLASPSVSVEIRASNPPHAVATAPSRAKSGASVTFDASASTDPDGDIASYEWNFGDGSPVVTTTSPTVTHTYVATRPMVISWAVRVVDEAGVADATGSSIRVTP